MRLRRKVRLEAGMANAPIRMVCDAFKLEAMRCWPPSAMAHVTSTSLKATRANPVSVGFASIEQPTVTGQEEKHDQKQI